MLETMTNDCTEIRWMIVLHLSTTLKIVYRGWSYLEHHNLKISEDKSIRALLLYLDLMISQMIELLEIIEWCSFFF